MTVNPPKITDSSTVKYTPQGQEGYKSVAN